MRRDRFRIGPLSSVARSRERGIRSVSGTGRSVLSAPGQPDDEAAAFAKFGEILVPSLFNPDADQGPEQRITPVLDNVREARSHLPAVPLGKAGIRGTALDQRVVDAGRDPAGRTRVHAPPVLMHPFARQMELLLYEGLSRHALFVRKRGDVADELASAEKVLSHSLLPELVSAVLLDLSGRSLHEANQAIEFARRIA